MGDYARVTLLAWPYPGRYGLPCGVVEELERHHALPPNDDPTTEIYLGDAGATVLAGDECSGPILAVVDECARQDTPGLWRVWDSGEKPQFRRRPNVNAQPRRAKKRAALVGSVVAREQ